MDPAFLETGTTLAELEEDERFLLMPDHDSGRPLILVELVGAGNPDSLVGECLGLRELSLGEVGA